MEESLKGTDEDLREPFRFWLFFCGYVRICSWEKVLVLFYQTCWSSGQARACSNYRTQTYHNKPQCCCFYSCSVVLFQGFKTVLQTVWLQEGENTQNLSAVGQRALRWKQEEADASWNSYKHNTVISIDCVGGVTSFNNSVLWNVRKSLPYSVDRLSWFLLCELLISVAAGN